MSQVAENVHFLTNEQRKAISHLLLQSIENGKLKSRTIVQVAKLYNVNRSVVYHIWNQLKVVGDASHNKTKNYERKRVQLNGERLCEVP